MLYAETAGMLEDSFSKESIGLMIVLLWGSLLEVQEEGGIPNGVSEKFRAKNHDVFRTVPA